MRHFSAGKFEFESLNITNNIAPNIQTNLDVVQATIVGHESRDLLTVLDELDSDAFSDGRVRLLGLDTTAI